MLTGCPERPKTKDGWRSAWRRHVPHDTSPSPPNPLAMVPEALAVHHGIHVGARAAGRQAVGSPVRWVRLHSPQPEATSLDVMASEVDSVCKNHVSGVLDLQQQAGVQPVGHALELEGEELRAGACAAHCCPCRRRSRRVGARDATKRLLPAFRKRSAGPLAPLITQSTCVSALLKVLSSVFSPSTPPPNLGGTMPC